MKRFFLSAVVLGLLASFCIAQNKTAAPKNKPDTGFKTNSEKVGYAMGLNIGRNLKRQRLIVDVNSLAQGIRDALSNAEPKLSQQQIEAAFRAFQEKLQAQRKLKAVKNKKDSEAFLAKNGKQKGVTTTKSGLQYKILKQGQGKSPKASDTVKTHYRGTLIDGTEFDSSYKRNMPATFPVQGVIKGWTEALQLMKVGAKWQLFIPSNLAYGEKPRDGSPIGPNAALVFEIELLGIEE